MDTVSEIASLKVGECFCRSQYFKAGATPAEINEAKRLMKNTLAAAIARAKKRNPGRIYQLRVLHAHTQQEFDIIVTANVVREEDEL